LDRPVAEGRTQRRSGWSCERRFDTNSETRKNEQPALFWEVTAEKQKSGLVTAQSPLVTDGKLVTAFGPAAGEHGPAIGCFHTDTKAMGLRPVTIIRLKRTFWHC
jgi:hypothetical protein